MLDGVMLLVFFFKQKTAYEIRPRDWSSDVCSSDLGFGLSRRRLDIGGRFSLRRIVDPDEALFDSSIGAQLIDRPASGDIHDPGLGAAAILIVICRLPPELNKDQ